MYDFIGFTRKDTAKTLLTSKFTENLDYIIERIFPAETGKIHGRGRPNEKIMMTSDTFKSMCMLASTENGKETRKYYIKLENCVFDYIQNENRP